MTDPRSTPSIPVAPATAEWSQPMTKTGRALAVDVANKNDGPLHYWDGRVASVEADARRAAIEEVRATLPEWFPCSCHPAYKDRGLEAPDCPTHDMERWLDELAVSR